MDPALLALALTAGMVAAFNPCGFAMLPAYLGWFLSASGGADPAGDGDGDDGGGSGTPAAVLRAVVVAACVTTGFVLVFGAVGLAVTALSLSVQRLAPWLTVVLGLALVGLGVAMVLGRRLRVPFLRPGRGPGRRGVPSMVLFGVTYGTVSLSCTLPVFLGTVVSGFAQADPMSGLAVFLAYAAGMGLVLSAVTVAVAVARGSAVRRLRGVLRHVDRISGALLVVAGAYVAWYGLYEIRLSRGGRPAAGPVDAVSRASASVSGWVQEIGATRIGAALVLVVAAATAGAVAARRRRRVRTGSVLSDHPQQRAHPADDVEVAQGGHGGLHVPLARPVGDE